MSVYPLDGIRAQITRPEAQKQRDHELKMLRRQSPQAMALDRWEATPTGGIPVIAQQPAPQSTISPAMGPSTNNSSTTVTFNVRYLSPGYVLPPPPPVELRSDRCPDQNKLLGSLVGAAGAICNLAKGKDGK